jgi:CubicO group peptidase (beta-lactamase class C family)
MDVDHENQRWRHSWTLEDPAERRMDSARLNALRDELEARGTTGFLVVRNNTVVHEWYCTGFGPEKPHYTASLAKSLVGGMALMLAIDDGLIEPDAPAAAWIPEWAEDPVKAKITIRHLATHTSGLSDSTTSGCAHDEQPGWKGRFWRGRSDAAFNPIEIALTEAPVLFEPGTGYVYSNPGMAVLGHVITAALQGTRWPELHTLLRERLMRPLGIPDTAWQISYDGTYPTRDLPVRATWGGGSYTARAIGRVAQLLLQQGVWEGHTLLQPATVKTSLRYASTAIPPRTHGEPVPASGLGWYTNFDGVWPNLPRDAIAGAGAEHQMLLIVPSRNLIVVRQGAALGDGTFWEEAERVLFTPLVDTFLDRLPGDARHAPYPASPSIADVSYDPVSTMMRPAFHSDNWPITWSNDNAQVTAYGDGRGFEPFLDEILSLGLVRIVGGPEGFQGINLRSPTGEQHGYGPAGLKASGLLSVRGVLYMWARNAGNSRLAWSHDRGENWTWAEWRFETSFGCPTFINFGRDYAGARDAYVYVVSHDAASAYEPADRMILARVPCDAVAERESYDYFTGMNEEGAPEWSADIADRGAVFVNPGMCRRSQITYNAGLGRYLWWQQAAGDDFDTRFQGGFGIYDAPEPWGPWTTAYFTREWDTGPGEMGVFPSKWMSPDGTICYLVSSSFDCFSVRRAHFRLAHEQH